MKNHGTHNIGGIAVSILLGVSCATAQVGNSTIIDPIAIARQINASLKVSRTTDQENESMAIDQATVAQLIETTAIGGLGISGKEQKLAKRIRKELGPAAIPQLLPLLKHENEGVRNLASYILCDIDGLTEGHLDALMESRLRGNGWILPAIARIGTPTAITFLIEELKKESQINTYAFELLGEKGVPYLVELYETEEIDEDMAYALGSIFEELSNTADGAIDPLTAIALDDKYCKSTRLAAILGLGSIGRASQRSAHALKELAEHDPEPFRTEAIRALTNMKAPEAVPYLLHDLGKNPNPITFRDLAALKENGISAGPSLIPYLKHDQWEARTCAARTIDYIGYKAAEQPLMELLNNSNDWRLVYVSVESLGRMHSTNSIPSLITISQKYWYPPVRKSAQQALEVINGKTTYEPKYHPNNFPFEFFAYQNVRLNSQVSSDDAGDENPIVPEDVLTSSELTNHSYFVYNNVRNDSGHKQIPSIGIKVDGGYLVGSDRGEWGGELVFIDSNGNENSGDLIVRDNIIGIHRTPEGIFAIAGLAHLMWNRGLVYMIHKDTEGNWHAKKWKALPGAPRSSALLKDGSLLINCYGNWQVTIAPDGNIKLSGRKKQ